MFQKIEWRATLITALIAGIAFSIPVFFFIRYGSYTGSWLLYLGSFLFLVVMWIHNTYESKKRGAEESILSLAFIGHATAVAGIIVACLLSFLLLVILVPGFLSAGTPDKILVNEPTQLITGRTKGLSFEVFMAATIINFSVGSFAGIIVPFYTKRNQTKDSKDSFPMAEKA